MQPDTTPQIDQQLLRKINRQLRTVKFMLSFFFLMFVAMLAILGFIAYKVVTFTHTVNDKISNIETSTSQKLDIKSQLCDNATTYVAKQLCE